MTTSDKLTDHLDEAETASIYLSDETPVTARVFVSGLAWMPVDDRITHSTAEDRQETVASELKDQVSYEEPGREISDIPTQVRLVEEPPAEVSPTNLPPEDNGPFAWGVWRDYITLTTTAGESVGALRQTVTDRLAIADGDIIEVEFAGASIDDGRVPADWQEPASLPMDNRHDSYLAAYVHESTLYTIAIGQKSNDSASIATVVELAPPVPSPYPPARLTGFSDEHHARKTAYQLMVSITSAARTGVSDPVETARDAVSYHGEEVPNPDIGSVETATSGEPQQEHTDSIPARPLSEDDFETVRSALNDGHETVDRILVPDDPPPSSPETREALEETPDEKTIVAFTVVTGDGEFIVYELAAYDAGFGWYRTAGDIATVTGRTDAE